MSITENNTEPLNIEFPLISQDESEDMKTFDLNKIFQMNVTYNFDILKNLILSLIQNQKQFQNQLNNLKTVLLSENNGQISPELLKKIIETKPTEQQKNNTDQNLIRQKKTGLIRAPRNDIKLETSILKRDVQLLNIL